MKNIDKIIRGDFEQCHYPFFWLCGGETVEEVVKAVERVYASGSNGMIVESRGFSDFDTAWWVLFDAILEKAESLQMRVMVVDEDSNFPTGHAFGWVNKPEYSHLKRSSVVEAHTEVIGPKSIDIVVGHPLIYAKTQEKDKRIGCFAFERLDDKNLLDLSNPIDLTDYIKDGILSWDVPKGEYRIVFIYAGTRYSELYENDFIDMTSEESVDLLIKSTYEEYERRYSKYFGKTFMGFFSDEPFIGNCYPFCGSIKYNIYSGDCHVGQQGLSMPYNDAIKAELDAVYGKDTTSMLASLWFWNEKVSPEFRNNYMNILAKRYRRCFSEKIGKWCKERGLLYIGHIVEDRNLHSKLGSGAVHYFHSQMGQDMAGVDVVLQQVIPGYSDRQRSRGGVAIAENEFYHYILGKLNSSAAHTYKDFNGKALCEATIGYGWAEGTQLAKWIFDFFLVRGTNFFVPGAICPKPFDNMHAPHWGENSGKDPQSYGYAKLIDYSKKVITCLANSKHIANVAILYNAQGEWMSDNSMLMERPAKILYDNHIDFDILCEDLLKEIVVVKGKCCLMETYDCIFVPYAEFLPKWLQEDLLDLQNKGADIVFIDGLPKNNISDFCIVPLNEVAEYCQQKGYIDIEIDNFHQLRHYHCAKDNEDIYMFFNESAVDVFEGEIYTGKQGNYNLYDFIGDKYYQGKGGEKIPLRLTPYQSVIVVYENSRGFEPYERIVREEEVKNSLNVKLYSYESSKICKEEFVMDTVQAISKIYPNFSGRIVYDFEIEIKEQRNTQLYFEEIGENAKVFVNGMDCGFAICQPFVYDITKAIKIGKNQVRVEVFTTLANAIKDPVSMFTPLTRTGISGKIKLLF